MKTCEFCGQMVNTDLPEGWQACNCNGAIDKRMREEAADRADQAIEDIFGDASATYGFMPMDEQTIEMLKETAHNILEGLARQVTVKLPNGTTVTLKINDYDVAISRKEVKSLKN